MRHSGGAQRWQSRQRAERVGRGAGHGGEGDGEQGGGGRRRHRSHGGHGASGRIGAAAILARPLLVALVSSLIPVSVSLKSGAGGRGFAARALSTLRAHSDGPPRPLIIPYPRRGCPFHVNLRDAGISTGCQMGAGTDAPNRGCRPVYHMTH